MEAKLKKLLSRLQNYSVEFQRENANRIIVPTDVLTLQALEEIDTYCVNNYLEYTVDFKNILTYITLSENNDKQTILNLT